MNKLAMQVAAQNLVVFCLGFFALVSQTLLLREFLSVYEGNELGIGAFFGSWLLWVAIGATLARYISKFSKKFVWLPLLYLPAFLIQRHLIFHSRFFADITAFELFPFTKMFPVSILANSVVSLVSGILFVLGCQWCADQERSRPVSRVYMFEALGAAAGGLLVTLAFWQELTTNTIFLLSSVILIIGLILAGLFLKRRLYVTIMTCLLIAAVLASLSLEQWNSWHNKKEWVRLLPAESYSGSFSTAHATYHYGRYNEQFTVLAWESITETVATSEYVASVAALHLAQMPTAKNILIIGPGAYSLCSFLAKLPQINRITWLHPDPKYPQQLLKVLLEKEGISISKKIDAPSKDVCSFIESHKGDFDLAILAAPAAITIAENRYFTRDFLQRLKSCLAPNAVVSLRGIGGENFMGSELAKLGASLQYTVSSVFSNLVIKPGDETWFIASDNDNLSENGKELQRRFASIPEASELYPPLRLNSLYQQDRIEFQKNKYRESIQAGQPQTLLNTDRRPVALLHTLLFIGRHVVTFSFVKLVEFLAIKGGIIIVFAIFLGLFARLLLPGKSKQKISASWLVFSCGACGIMLSLLLMLMFQARFGSILIYVGLASALFMLGLFAGSAGMSKLMTGREYLTLRLTLLLQIILCVLLLRLPDNLSIAFYFMLFFCFGFLSGGYIPLAIFELERRENTPNRTGSIIDACDHLGGALGGLLGGLVFIPILGLDATIYIIIALLATNLMPYTAARKSYIHKSELRAIGHVCVVLVLLLAITRYFWKADTTKPEVTLTEIAQEMVPLAQLEKHSRPIEFFAYQFAEGTSKGGYIFSTANLEKNVEGYGGPMELALRIDIDGKLQELRILSSRETPAYLLRLEKWLNNLEGINIFSADTISEIDTVSGATYSSEAILQILQNSGIYFGNMLNNNELGVKPSAPAGKRHFKIVAFLMLACGTLVLRHKRSRILRYAFLMAIILVLGVLWNYQYAPEHVLALLTGDVLTGFNFSIYSLLVFGVPLLVVLFGNIYCGYLCPFGALQELLGLIIPTRHQFHPRRKILNFGRCVKYWILLIIACITLFNLWQNFETNDPLTTFWMSTPVPVVAAIVLFLSLFWGRFWCRNLCPTGAFLSILNRFHLLKKLIPVVPWQRCIYGVCSSSDLDCICCDRCIHSRTKQSPYKLWPEIIFLVAITLMATWYLTDNIKNIATTDKIEMKSVSDKNTPTSMAGQTREVNMQALRKLIQARKLSDREAMHYRKIDEKGAK